MTSAPAPTWTAPTATIDFVYFGNCAVHGVKQGTIRGQACTIELVDYGLLPRWTPLVNVEGGCATGSMAIHSAFKDIRSGESDVVLAMGVEKLGIRPSSTARVSWCSTATRTGTSASAGTCTSASQLARMEARVVLPRVMARFPTLSLAVDRAELRHQPTVVGRTLRALPLRAD